MTGRLSITKLLPAMTVCAALMPAAAFSATKDNEAKNAETGPPRIQLAILLDTSGSMNGLINQARTQLWKIVNELATARQNGKAPNLEVALYEYGKSSIPRSEGYLRQIVPLTDDLDKLSDELFALKTNGGQEYCGQVIQAATNGLKWSKSDRDLKLIFIAGNEPFTQGPVDYREACAAAVKRGITVNTIHCGAEQTGIRTGWQDAAKLADGSFSNINQNRKVATIQTPFDRKLTVLGGRINKTYVAFGRPAERSRRLSLQQKQDRLARSAAPAAGAARAAFKGKSAYRASAWDLIDAIKEGKIKLKDVKSEHLPKEMQKMTLAERESYLKKKSAERETIRKQIKELSAKRRKYIAEARKKQAGKGGEAFDEALLKTIRKQASKKKFRFEKQ